MKGEMRYNAFKGKHKIVELRRIILHLANLYQCICQREDSNGRGLFI